MTTREPWKKDPWQGDPMQSRRTKEEPSKEYPRGRIIVTPPPISGSIWRGSGK